MRGDHSIFVHPEKWAGQSVSEKINNIRQKMKVLNTDFHLITALDEVAWTLNLRGSDVAYNPVFLGYIALSENQTFFICQNRKNNGRGS
ncbi:aminopeptidase P family N-terminal domain-containing protein [Capnocytophaga canimorsus]|nr:aminopeptidase P family N-terminal domain-containing protein [Capnocytophaga canimorsus]WGU69155.1 aminopeptidase P family N-terminal domain-containing protein [Capnocytophaga canimorsus]